MAAINTTPSIEEGVSPARVMWDRWIEKHPNVDGVLNIIGSIFGFFANGHFIVAIGHWAIRTAGRIAETALLLATLWVTAANIAPGFVAQVVGGTGVVSTLNSLSLIAFSLLPEVIVFSAIIVTYEHWQRFFTNRRAVNPAWVWASLYTIPTGTFIIMTVYTLSSFVSNEGAIAHITGMAIVIRCLAGWFYALVELVYLTLGRATKRTITVHQVEDAVAEIVATTRATFEEQVAGLVAQATQVITEQRVTFQREVALDNEMADQQFAALVDLINQQNYTFRQFAAQLTEVRREVSTTVTEIREFRITQETPAIPIKSSVAVVESGDEPGARVLLYCQVAKEKGYKPTLQTIMDECRVAKKTATKYRNIVYGPESTEE